MALYGPNAMKWARWLGRIGVGLFAVCLLLIALDFPLDKWVAARWTGINKSVETGSSQQETNTTCRAHFDGLLRQADAPDKPDILLVWPNEVQLAGRLCLVVAGIASKGSETQLVATLSEKKYGADRAQQRYDGALAAATDARRQLADTQAKANVAEREKSPDAEQLKTNKQKLAADSDEKEKSRTAAFDTLTVANKAYEDAAAAANRGAPVVEVALFLNERRTPLVAKALAMSGPQLLTYEFGQIADANADDAKFWRDLVARNTKWGAMPLTIGISRSQSTVAERTAATGVELRVYWPSLAMIGGLAMVLMVAAFVIFAANSTVVRDSNRKNKTDIKALTDVTKKATDARAKANASPDDAALKEAASQAEAQQKQAETEAKYPMDCPIGPFSLGRCQMALWLGLTTVGFIFIWLTLGFYRNVLTDGVLVLLGINGLTGLASVMIDGPPGSPQPITTTKGFLKDITSDGQGPALHRIQIMMWTCLLAIIFGWNAATGFVFVDFDTKLLLLMGIASSTYLGFKTQEPPAPKQAP